MTLEPPASSQADYSSILRHGLLVLCGFAALAAAAFAPTLWRGELLVVDDGLYNFYASFHKPNTFWSPELFSGFPVHVDPQRQTWYPVAILLAHLPGGWNLYIAFGFVAAATLAYAYIYNLTRCRFASAIAGLAFGFGGLMFMRVRHPTFLHTMAWVPLVLLGFDKLVHHPGGRWLAATSLAVAFVVLAGQPQLAFYAMALFVLYALVISGKRPRALTWCAGAIALGMALSALQWVPTVAHTPLSYRADLGLEHYLLWSLSPERLLMAFAPYVHKAFALTDSAHSQVVEQSYYVGLTSLVFAAMALMQFRVERRVAFWAVVAALAALLATGEHTPAGGWTYLVPGMNKFRIPARHLFQLSIALPFLAGLGAASWANSREPTARRGPWMALVVTTAVALAAVGLASRSPLAEGTSPLVCLIGIAVTCAVLGLAFLRPTPVLRLLVVGLLAGDLLLFGYQCEWRSAQATHQQFTPPQHAQEFLDALRPRQQRVLTADGKNASPLAFPPTRCELWGVPNASGYSSLTYSRYGALLGMGYDGKAYEDELFSDNNYTLDVLAVRYVFISSARVDLAPRFGRFQPVAQYEGVAVLENRRALQGAWLVGRTKRMTSAQALVAVTSGQLPDGSAYSPLTTAVIEGEGPELVSATASTKWSLETLSTGTTRRVVRVRTQRAALAIFSSVHAPGWTASVDGKPVPIETAFFVLQGVPVPAGSHVIELVYAPRPLRQGGAISLLAALIAAALALWRPHGRFRGQRS